MPRTTNPMRNIDRTTVYRITGKFGGGFNLAIWRLKSPSPNFKFVNNTNCHAARDVRARAW